jgi:hypothetical protein
VHELAGVGVSRDLDGLEALGVDLGPEREASRFLV